MKRLLALSAVTKTERHEATSLALDLVNSLNGWVKDTQFFSNKMATIRFVLPSAAMASFVDRLNHAHIVTDLPGGDLPEMSDGEQAGSLQITFLHDEPDLIRPIPAVPG